MWWLLGSTERYRLGMPLGDLPVLYGVETCVRLWGCETVTRFGPLVAPPGDVLTKVMR